MQIVSIGDNLHKMSKPVSAKIRKKYFKMSSAETLPRVVVKLRVNAVKVPSEGQIHKTQIFLGRSKSRSKTYEKWKHYHMYSTKDR